NVRWIPALYWLFPARFCPIPPVARHRGHWIFSRLMIKVLVRSTAGLDSPAIRTANPLPAPCAPMMERRLQGGSIMRTRPLIGWTLAVIAIAAASGGLVGSLPLAAQQGGDRCAANPNVLGVSRTIEIDATTGPRFGGLQTRDNDFLKEGEVVLTFD